MVYLSASSLYAKADTVTDSYDRPIGDYNDTELENTYFKNSWAIVSFLDSYSVSDEDNNVVCLIQVEVTQTVNSSTTEKLAVIDLGVAFNYHVGPISDDAGNLYMSDHYCQLKPGRFFGHMKTLFTGWFSGRRSVRTDGYRVCSDIVAKTAQHQITHIRAILEKNTPETVTQFSDSSILAGFSGVFQIFVLSFAAIVSSVSAAQIAVKPAR